jgi:uncharacterized protein
MHIVALYAALLSFLFVLLSVRTILARRRLQIAVGDKANTEMTRAMRVHANFAEYVPLSLILIYFVEQAAAPTLLVHVLGSCLLLGRVLHAYGVSQTHEKFVFRVSGMIFTLTTIMVAALYLLLKAGNIV